MTKRLTVVPAMARPALAVGAHKLFPPPVKPNAIGRHAIVERIFAGRDIRVAVLQGPAGSGKSTTLQQIMSACVQAGWATAWLSFDDADNDPRRFEAHVHALMASALRSAHAPQTQAARDDETQPGLTDWLLDHLAQFESPVALFLDEFQALRHDAILQFFRAALPRLPARAHVFIGSRTLPEVGLATLLVNGSAAVLRADDLRFTAVEASEFFASESQLAIGPDEVDVIYQRTEGWPAGLQLFRLALASPEVRTSLDDLASHGPRELAEYLTDNVVSLQAPEVQEFLLRTSLLRRLTGPLCDAVVGRPGSQALLLELERSGLFLSALDSSNGWFKYHGLFAQFLADNLRRNSQEGVREVHARAAAWHLAQESYEEAVYHAVQAQDHALAIDALNRWSSRLVARAELVTVERWYDQLPFEEVTQHVELTIKVAWALVFMRRRAKVRPLAEVLARYKGQGDLSKTTDPELALAMVALFEDDLFGAASIADKPEVHELFETGFPAFELSAAANLMAFAKITYGDFESARKLLVLARVHNARSGAAFSGGYTTAVIGINHMVQGQLREALEGFDSEAAGPPAQLDKSLASAAQAACHIWALYEANQLGRVEYLGTRYQQDIATSVIPDFSAVALLSISRMHQIRGRQALAVETLDTLEQIGHESAWPRLVQLADWERVRRALAAGDVERAGAISQRMAPQAGTAHEHWLRVSENMEGPALGAIRLAIAQGRHADAATDLAAHAAVRPERGAFLRIKLCLLDTLLQHAKGQHNAAHRCLRRALQLARPGAYVRSFLDEGEVIVEMLRQEYQTLLGQPDDKQAAERNYIELLLAASGTDLSRPAARAGLSAGQSLEPLSEREREILGFLCDGISNKEIASRLFVSENTIKFHLKKVFAKLDVRSRSQAINTARELRLVK